MSFDVTKVCTKCGAEKFATDEFFRVEKRGKNGPYLRAQCKACDTAWKNEHRKQVNGYHRKYRAKAMTQAKANQAVRYALDDGTLTRGACIICGSDETEAHHEDYDKPLEVVWLCRRHHADAHWDRIRELHALRQQLAEAQAVAVEQAEKVKAITDAINGDYPGIGDPLKLRHQRDEWGDELHVVREQLAAEKARADALAHEVKQAVELAIAEKARADKADELLSRTHFRLDRDKDAALLRDIKEHFARRTGECWTRDEEIQNPAARRTGGEHE